ncbi:MAG: MFS transporter [Candidatus Aegiribacteria sp.]|nr:MFS transporter [Candidatus Aegiribacteria sp.]
MIFTHHCTPETGKLDRDQTRIFWLVFSLVILSWISIKITLPALPGFPEAFGCSSSGVKTSVSLYLLFFAFSQPFWGGVVQKSGYRRAVVLSFIVAMTGSIVAMLSSSLPVYIVGRSLEGIGIGAASPVGRTLLVDSFERAKLTSRIGLISGVAAVMPALAPILGVYLMMVLGWRAIFGLLFVLTLAWFCGALRWLPRSHTKSSEEIPVMHKSLLKINMSILKNTGFWGFAIAYASMLGGLLGYYSAIPYWLHAQLGVSPSVYPYLVIPTVLLFLGGLSVSSVLTRKRRTEDILFGGLLSSLLAASAAIGLMILGLRGVWSIVSIMSLYGFAVGIVTPQANAGVLIRFKYAAAPASALLSLIIFGSASLTSAIAMRLTVSGALWQLTLYICLLSVTGLLAGYFWIWRPSRASTTSLAR